MRCAGEDQSLSLFNNANCDTLNLNYLSLSIILAPYSYSTDDHDAKQAGWKYIYIYFKDLQNSFKKC